MKKLTRYEVKMLNDLIKNYDGKNDDCYAIEDEMYCKLIEMMLNTNSTYKATYIRQFTRGLMNVSAFASNIAVEYGMDI